MQNIFVFLVGLEFQDVAMVTGTDDLCKRKLGFYGTSVCALAVVRRVSEIFRACKTVNDFTGGLDNFVSGER